jgi:hypothetical protein
VDKQTANEASLSPTRPLVLGDKIYACRPVKLSDLAGISIKIRKQQASRETPLGRLVSDPSFKLLPVQAQVEMAKIAAAAQVKSSAPIDGAGLLDGLAEPASLSFAIWLCCKDQHPGLAHAEIAGHVTDENAAEVFVLFDEASGMSQLGNSAGQSHFQVSGTGEAS